MLALDFSVGLLLFSRTLRRMQRIFREDQTILRHLG
jgi:hypothetical protein